MTVIQKDLRGKPTGTVILSYQPVLVIVHWQQKHAELVSSSRDKIDPQMKNQPHGKEGTTSQLHVRT